MALASAVFFDTSILISAFIEMGETPSPSEAALDAITRQLVRRPLTAWHCVLEFYAVATRLPANVRLDPKLAGGIVRNQILERFEVCDCRQMPTGLSSRRSWESASPADAFTTPTSPKPLASRAPSWSSPKTGGTSPR